MSKKFFTADFHLGFEQLMTLEKRPFKTIQDHDKYLISMCCKMTQPEDTIYHIGDLAQFNQRLYVNVESEKRITSAKLIDIIPANFINIRGNHDLNNRVKSLCDSMQIHLTKKFPDVICGHYPSYDIRSEKYAKDGWIILCGHVHSKWKHCLDLDHSCLNINCGIDVWNYKLISDEEIAKYIEYILKLPKEKVIKVKKHNGKIQYV